MRYVVLFSALGISSFFVTFGFLALQEPVLVVERSQAVASPTLPESFEAKLLFVGDMMFDRSIRADLATSSPEALFGVVAPTLAGADFVAGNLEGPITNRASVSVGSKVGNPNNTRFTFAPSITQVLTMLGVDLVTIGNNHISDFGKEGIVSTEAALAQVGVASIGNPFATTTEPVIKNIQGIKVAFTAYNEFIRPNASSTQAAIVQARALGADFVVVMTHWGDEYTSSPPARVRKLARMFADSGADLIIGTHSHVIGEWEDIGRTRVYYSLGNFIFDQYWSESVRCGLIVTVRLTKTGATTTASYEEIETHLERDGSTTLQCPLSQTRDILS